VLLATLLLCPQGSFGQYIGEGNKTALQRTAVVDGLKTDLDEIGPTIYTNRTTTHLNCDAGIMAVIIEFSDPFFGVIYPNGSRHSACFTHGSGSRKYQINLPLKGCGTQKIERRVFMNNIIVRFHKGLELEGDEVKTIICRYPSPKVLLPPVSAPLESLPEAVIPPAAKHVGELEILLIICGILFLALLLVGMACSYTCLKKRNIHLVRRAPPSLAPSTLSKMSGSSMLIDGLKIPRATVTSTSGSEAALVSQSETLPSDYPSESPSSGSEVEEVDVQSLERVSVREEIEAYENTAFQIEERLSSVYSDHMAQSDAEIVSAQQMIKPPQPSFMVRVKKAVTPPRTPEPDYPIQLANSQSLTTIFERDESFRPESLPGSEHAMMLSDSGDDLEPPAHFQGPPKFGQVQKRSQPIPAPPPPPPSDYNIRRIDNLETIVRQRTDIEEVEERMARRVVAPRPESEPEIPPITSHRVDDRHVSTLTETHVTEDVERHKRYVKQYHVRPKPPKWNVAIRHYPGPKYADEMESSGPEWENYSEPGSEVFRRQLYYGADSDSERPELLEHPPPPNWNILLRVLEPPETGMGEICVLSEEDKDKWYQILHTESTLRTMLSQATVREDYERIRYDQRYERLFSPDKWDVIIRILTPPSAPRRELSSDAPSDTDSHTSKEGRRYRKNEHQGAVRKGSLPPLHEYDPSPHAPSRSRRSSKSSVASGVRSVTETEVNFGRDPDIAFRPARPDEPDTDADDRLSAKTGRSLARSTSEFMEDWRHHPDIYSESSSVGRKHHVAVSSSHFFETSPDTSPRPKRALFEREGEARENLFEREEKVVVREGQGLFEREGEVVVREGGAQSLVREEVVTSGTQVVRGSHVVKVHHEFGSQHQTRQK